MKNRIVNVCAGLTALLSGLAILYTLDPILAKIILGGGLLATGAMMIIFKNVFE